MPELQSWAFMDLERIWVWKTATGYMMFELGQESFVVLFPSAQIAGAIARDAKLLGHPEPCNTKAIWRAATKLLDDRLSGYAWIDGKSVEFYRVADLPSSAIDLFGREQEENTDA